MHIVDGPINRRRMLYYYNVYTRHAAGVHGMRDPPIKEGFFFTSKQ